MQTYSSLVIANEFIDRSLAANGLITHMQVQKLVYLAHGWTLAACDAPLIEDSIEAWTFGPVIRRLYDALKRYGKQPIDNLIKWGDDTPLAADGDSLPAKAMLSNSLVSIIQDVWQSYAYFSAFQLSALTHQDGTPWKAIYSPNENKIIPNYLISQYFKAI